MECVKEASNVSLTIMSRIGRAGMLIEFKLSVGR
jgi:hypothetical protein